MNILTRSVLALAAAWPIAALAAPVAEVLAVRGEALSGTRALAVGDRLEPGSDVRTGASGRVRLRFLDGSTVVVSDRTVLKIERFELADARRSAATLLLESGLIGQKVAPSAGGSWEVRTPTAVTAVRGTEFSVEAHPDYGTEVNVQSGKVEVEALQSAADGTRSLQPRSRVELDTRLDGTRCNAKTGCNPSMTWTPDRILRTQERLSGV